MILSSVLSFARAQLQTNSSGLTDDNGIIFANEALQDFHRRLVQKNVDASQLTETSIVTSTGINNYPSNPSLLALKAIEANYVDTSNNNFTVAQQVDVANLPGNFSFSYLRSNTNPVTPLFDDRGNSFEVFPTPTSSIMIRMFYFAQPSIYTSSVASVNYPENLDITILGWRIAANYLYSLGTSRIPDGDKYMARYEERVKQYIDTLSRGVQTPQKTVPIQITGWQF